MRVVAAVPTVSSFRRFLVGQALGVAVLNAAMNLGYTWWLWHGNRSLTLFATNAVGYDLAGTPLWIGVLSTSLGTASVRKKLAGGAVDIARIGSPPRLFHAFPRGILWRTPAVGLLMGLLFGVPLWIALRTLAAAGTSSVTLTWACGAKVLITLALSIIIVPFVVLCALADVAQARR